MSRPSATERLARILSMVPWIAERDAPRIDEVCARFAITREELVADLDVVFVVGLYPYTPDSLIEVQIDDDHVAIDYTNFFERPLRLSRDEALSILAAGVVSATLPGHDPGGALSRGLAKIADVLNIDLDDDLGVVVDDATASIHQVLDRAVHDRTVVHLSYYSHARDEQTQRDVEPLRLFSTDGIWYLDAHCRATEEHRVFRLDRISSMEPVDETFAETAAPGDPSAFRPGRDLPTVTIDIAPDDAWVVDRYPTEAVDELPDGRLRIRLLVSATPWLDRLLLQLGPGCTVVDCPVELDDRGPIAARRVLVRYRRR